MRDNHIKVIREACIKANSEIVELKFGCALQRPNSSRHYMVIEDMTWGANTKEVWVNSVPFGSMSLPLRVPKEDILNGIPDDNGEVWQVVGRPIRLADVLLAIYAIEPAMKTRLQMECDGQFKHMTPEEPYRDSDLLFLGPTWNLRKDDLTEQSDECLSFLAELLK